jgi:amino acid adenylation domain-containing protein
MMSIAARIFERLQEQPDAPAVVFHDVMITRETLLARVGAFAAALAHLPAGSRVAVCMSRSPDMIAALLGIWRAGHVQVPLDPTYPPDRLHYVLEDVDASALICGRAEEELLTRFRGEWVVAEDLDPGEHEAPPAKLAYILYTSGSTGRPKGVCVSHAALSAFAREVTWATGLSSNERVLAITPIAFDISMLELHVTLSNGACIVLADSEEAKSGAALALLIDAKNVDVVQGTPSSFRLLYEGSTRPTRRPKLLCGGEAWHASLKATLCTASDDVFNLYGPTETTVYCSARRVLSDDAQVLIGRPMPHAHFFVSETGELLIGGECLADGYWRRPELDAERFARYGEERVYRTGDRVALEASGEVRFVGRMDEQIKWRGHRIELGEIEAQLAEHMNVRVAACVLLHDAIAPHLVAHVVVSRPTEESELRHHLAQTLPAYMIPSRFIFRDSLPLTPAGKIDRKAL